MSFVVSRCAILLVCGLALPLAAQPQSLTTLFTSDNGGSSGWVVMFDATIANPQGIRVTALDVNCSGVANTPIEVHVWLTPFTYIGNERNAAVWTRVSTGTALSQPRNSPTFVDVEDFSILGGSTFGVAIQVIGSGQAYTNGTGSNQNYSDANLSLQLGAALASEFLSTGLLFSPRVFNGTIYYATRGDATYGVYGEGCRLGGTIPTLAAASSSLPRVGTNFVVEIGNGPAAPTPGALALGFSKASAFGLSLPLDLSIIGMNGCRLFMDPLVQSGITLVNGNTSVAYPIPANNSTFGTTIYHQAFLFDPGASPLGLSATNAGEGLIGR